MSKADSAVRHQRNATRSVRSIAIDALCIAIEAGVMLLVCAAPWAFGAVEPELEFLLVTGLAVLIALWSMRILLEGKLRWAKCPVTLCLGGLFIFGVLQLVPLPAGLLRVISPTTADLYEKLLPREPEVLPSVEVPAAPMARWTLSLYPAATRHELVQLLALLLLFTLVRNNIASVAALRRLSFAALINGSALAYLGLAQSFSSPPDTLYWNFKSPGRVFGPFINRNHFAFYMNLSIGLGIGLLLYTYSRSLAGDRTRQWVDLERDRGDAGRRTGRGQSDMHRRHARRPRDLEHSPHGEGLLDMPRQLVSDLWGNPRVMWISGALSLMITSSIVCLSRGGFLALLGAAFVCVSIKIWTSSRSLRLEAGLLALTMALGLLIWFGVDEIEKRMGTIWTGAALEEGRSDLWRDSLRAAVKFPLLGSGYGTFQHIEPLHRSKVEYILNEYAHNEYVEALVEGGVLRLGLTLLAIVLTFRLGYRAVRQHERSSSSGLVLGALLAFSTLAIHSFGEFGVHVPSIAVLGTVVGAHLCALGGPAATERAANQTNRTNGSEYAIRLGGTAPVAGAVLLVLLGWTLIAREWVQARVQLFWRAAWKVAEADARPDSRDLQIAYLAAAADMAPAHARLLVELARAHLDLYESESDRLDETAESDDDSQDEERARLEREHLIPALSRYLQARDACPLMGQPHVRIAAYIDTFKSADVRTAYLDRAKLLVPWDPELWYICGVQELLDGQQARAWASWHRSLELSELNFQQIVDGSATMLDDEGLLEHVLPDRPELLVRAATHLHPKPEQTQEREPFLKKAQLVWQSVPPERLDAQQWYFKALIDRNLGNWREAVSAYERALVLEPGEVDWRYELADLLFQEGKIDESHRELVTILRQRPDHKQARQLYEVVSYQRATQK